MGGCKASVMMRERDGGRVARVRGRVGCFFTLFYTE